VSIKLRKVRDLEVARKSIKSIIKVLELDLNGKTVMTEFASGPFALTPFIALLAGAKKVICVSKDSVYGKVEELKTYFNELSSFFEFSGEIVFTEDKYLHVHEADVITNLSMLRPIDSKMLSLAKNDVVIGLMFEPWEKRESDIDFSFCKKNQIPVVGINEEHENLKIFEFVGLIICKLAFEQEHHLLDERVLLVGSGPFAENAQKYLRNLGADVYSLESIDESSNSNDFDLIVICEHHDKSPIISDDSLLSKKFFISQIDIIHICGNLDYKLIRELGLKKWPEKEVDVGFMTVTTDYIGIEPVVRLHAGGLKACTDYISKRNGVKFNSEYIKMVDE
tara:strand:- start:138192 stop:139202 length:1011 start_codon:yes stop_codon:yes gene_type:complete